MATQEIKVLLPKRIAPFNDDLKTAIGNRFGNCLGFDVDGIVAGKVVPEGHLVLFVTDPEPADLTFMTNALNAYRAAVNTAYPDETVGDIKMTRAETTVDTF
jgi:hypothetical protein